MTRTNLWTANASLLGEAYARETGQVGFEVVTRFLLMHLPSTPQRIVDVGGGYGQQAIMLATAGHTVVIVDIDPGMLAIARHLLLQQSDDIQSRVQLVEGDGTAAAEIVGTGFDLACCHSVLMYEDQPAPLLVELTKLVRLGGLISVMSINSDAYAMRSGLQGRWLEAAQLLSDAEVTNVGPIETRKHTRAEVTRILADSGAIVRTWQGVGIFTDHLTEAIVVDDPELVYIVEWLAGTRDPYRQVARCFHLLAERVP